MPMHFGGPGAAFRSEKMDIEKEFLLWLLVEGYVTADDGKKIAVALIDAGIWR